MENEYHQLCIYTDNSYALLNPRSNRIAKFYHKDKQVDNFYNENSLALLANDDIAIGSFSNMAVFSPYLLRHMAANASHVIYLTDLLVNGVSIHDMDNNSPLKGNLDRRSNIRMEHSQNSIILRFFNFNYGTDVKNVYEAKLKGYNEDWSMASTINFVAYRNLSTSTYHFPVYYRENNGDWITCKDLATI